MSSIITEGFGPDGNLISGGLGGAALTWVYTGSGSAMCGGSAPEAFTYDYTTSGGFILRCHADASFSAYSKPATVPSRPTSTIGGTRGLTRRKLRKLFPEPIKGVYGGQGRAFGFGGSAEVSFEAAAKVEATIVDEEFIKIIIPEAIAALPIRIINLEEERAIRLRKFDDNLIDEDLWIFESKEVATG